MYQKKKEEEYIASRLAREALEDMNCPKQIAYEETAKMMIARQITVSMNKEMEELTNLMIKSLIRGFLDNEKNENVETKEPLEEDVKGRSRLSA